LIDYIKGPKNYLHDSLFEDKFVGFLTLPLKVSLGQESFPGFS